MTSVMIPGPDIECRLRYNLVLCLYYSVLLSPAAEFLVMPAVVCGCVGVGGACGGSCVRACVLIYSLGQREDFQDC